MMLSNILRGLVKLGRLNPYESRLAVEVVTAIEGLVPEHGYYKLAQLILEEHFQYSIFSECTRISEALKKRLNARMKEEIQGLGVNSVTFEASAMINAIQQKYSVKFQVERKQLFNEFKNKYPFIQGASFNWVSSASLKEGVSIKNRMRHSVDAWMTEYTEEMNSKRKNSFFGRQSCSFPLAAESPWLIFLALGSFDIVKWFKLKYPFMMPMRESLMECIPTLEEIGEDELSSLMEGSVEDVPSLQREFRCAAQNSWERKQISDLYNQLIMRRKFSANIKDKLDLFLALILDAPIEESVFKKVRQGDLNGGPSLLLILLLASRHYYLRNYLPPNSPRLALANVASHPSYSSGVEYTKALTMTNKMLNESLKKEEEEARLGRLQAQDSIRQKLINRLRQKLLKKTEEIDQLKKKLVEVSSAVSAVENIKKKKKKKKKKNKGRKSKRVDGHREDVVSVVTEAQVEKLKQTISEMKNLLVQQEIKNEKFKHKEAEWEVERKLLSQSFTEGKTAFLRSALENEKLKKQLVDERRKNKELNSKKDGVSETVEKREKVIRLLEAKNSVLNKRIVHIMAELDKIKEERESLLNLNKVIKEEYTESLLVTDEKITELQKFNEKLRRKTALQKNKLHEKSKQVHRENSQGSSSSSLVNVPSVIMVKAIPVCMSCQEFSTYYWRLWRSFELLQSQNNIFRTNFSLLSYMLGGVLQFTGQSVSSRDIGFDYGGQRFFVDRGDMEAAVVNMKRIMVGGVE